MLLVIADSNSVVRISRNPNENDDRISFGQPLFQRVNASMIRPCLIPMPLKNICDAVCGNEAKRSFQFRKQSLSVRILPKVPQEIGGSIGRTFPICLVVDTIF